MLNKKILFIDRDGTIISEPIDFQVDSIDKLIFEKNVINSLNYLKNFGYKFVMVTNQDGLGTSEFPKKSFYIPHNMMIKILNSQGISFEEILICPHYPKEFCYCRKPKIKLVEHWISNNILDKANSYVIGDRHTDMKLAKNMGISGLQYNKNKLNWNKITSIITKKNLFDTVTKSTK